MSEYAEFNARMLAKVEKSFLAAVKKDAKLKHIAGRIRDGTTYDDALDYAERAGELLSESYLNAFKGLDFLAGDTAQAVLPPTLEIQHDLMATVIEQIQNNINQMIGSNLQPQVPEVDTNRIDGLVKAVSNSEGIEHTRELLSEPVINFTQSIVDRAVRDNAKLQSDAGHKAYIVRTAEAPGVVTRTHIVRSRKGKEYKYSRTYQVPCEWCARLAGRYDYESVRNANNDVYKRHSACRCRVTYTVGSYRQNVWKHKETWTEEQAEEQKRLVASEVEDIEKDNEQKAESTQYIRQFHEAKNYKEAEEFARNILNIDYMGLERANVEVLNVFNKEIARIYDTFGNLHDNNVMDTIFYYKKKAEFVAAYNPPMSTVLVRKVTQKTALKDMAHDAIINNKIGFWSSKEPEHAIRHEVGHAIEKLYYKKNDEVKPLITSLRRRTQAECGITDNTWSREGGTRAEMQKAGELLSYYGLMDDGEFIAESVASYMSNEPKAVAIEVVNILLRGGKK